MTTNDKINLFIGGQKIKIEHFKELRLVGDILKSASQEKLFQIFSWFRFIQESEIPGWRTKEMVTKMCKILNENFEDKPLVFYALFCPSYKKGKGAFGFRTDGVGLTSREGIYNLGLAVSKTKDLGFFVSNPVAIFFDLAIEQHDLVLENGKITDLKINAQNLSKEMPQDFLFLKLSSIEQLKNVIGYTGMTSKYFGNENILRQVVERGKKFYQLFGWTDDQIEKRSLVVANSEAFVANYFKNRFPQGIMIYTPTMLERSKIYSPGDDENPIPILFPKKRLQ